MLLFKEFNQNACREIVKKIGKKEKGFFFEEILKTKKIFQNFF